MLTSPFLQDITSVSLPGLSSSLADPLLLRSTCVTWAASTSTWNNVASSGPVAGQYATCAQAVQDPAAFDEAYFEINYLRGALLSFSSLDQEG